MDQKCKQYNDGQSTPKYRRNSKQRIKVAFNRSRPIYLTDNQLSSSDQTKSSSEMNLIRIEYQSRIKKIQKENKDLKQIIIQLKASQFYELDEQRIKGVIRQNQGLKTKIIQCEQEIKILDEQLSKLQIQNQYLKRNNKELKDNYEVLVKDMIKQRHSIKKIACVYDDENYSMESSQIHKEKQQKYTHQNIVQKNYQQKINQVPVEIDLQDKNKKLRLRSNKSRHRANSKSQQRNLVNSIGTKNMMKKSKKHADVPSTAQSQSIKRYSSSHNLLTFKVESKLKQNKSSTPKNNSDNPSITTRKKNQQAVKQDYNGEYFQSKREPYLGYNSKKKKCVYYN